MALIKCSECGNVVSDKADVCPKCGAPVTQAPAETQLPKMRSRGSKRVGVIKKIAIGVCILAVVVPSALFTLWKVCYPEISFRRLDRLIHAVMGYTYDQGILADSFFEGTGDVEVNYEKAFYWYKRAVKNGDSESMFGLGKCYYLGLGTVKDEAEGVKWIKMAAAEEVHGAKIFLDSINGLTNTPQRQSDISLGGWTYGNNVDDLTGNVTSINAYLSSTNAVEYDNYGHTTRLLITLSYSTMDVTSEPHNLFMISGCEATGGKPRFSDFQGSGFLAVFDDAEIDDTWRLVSMPSERHNLFLFNEHRVNDFISKLKASKTCKIQVNLEHGGKKTFTFNTAGLKWDY